MSAKHYENPTMLSRVIAKNVGDVFLRHSVVTCNGGRRRYVYVYWRTCDVQIRM